MTKTERAAHLMLTALRAHRVWVGDKLAKANEQTRKHWEEEADLLDEIIDRLQPKEPDHAEPVHTAAG